MNIKETLDQIGSKETLDWMECCHRVLEDLFGRRFPADVTFRNHPRRHGGSHTLARGSQDEHVFTTNWHSRSKYPLPCIRPGGKGGIWIGPSFLENIILK